MVRTTAVRNIKIFRPGGRRPQLEHTVTFVEMFPVQLANAVSGKGQKTADVSCLQEMAVMFACMKKHEFKEVKCGEEINAFMTCYNNHQAEKAAIKKKEESGQLPITKNSRNLTSKQLNQLLAKYPQYNVKRKPS